jgi:cytochrome c oxidase assembly protein subunit 15
MVGGVFFEHGHRMAAGLVGFLTVILAIWTQVSEERRGVRILGWTALVLVVAQGLLGGLTVVLLLPTSVSVAHACLAQTFLCTLVAYVFATSREWIASGEPAGRIRLRTPALLVTCLAYTQLVLGAVMRHLDERSWAAETTLPIPDFPLALGRVIPPLDTLPVAVHFAHRVGALAVLGAALVLWARARGTGDSRFSAPAGLLVIAVLLQGSLGAATVLSRRGVLPTTAHVMTGAFVLGLSFFLTLRAFRHTRPEAAGLPAFPRPDPVRT